MQLARTSRFEPITFTWTGPADSQVGLKVVSGADDRPAFLPVGSDVKAFKPMPVHDAAGGAKFLDLVNSLRNVEAPQHSAPSRGGLYSVGFGDVQADPGTAIGRNYPHRGAPAAAVEAAQLGTQILESMRRDPA